MTPLCASNLGGMGFTTRLALGFRMQMHAVSGVSQWRSIALVLRLDSTLFGGASELGKKLRAGLRCGGPAVGLLS